MQGHHRDRISRGRTRATARLTLTPHQPSPVTIGRPPHTPWRAVKGGRGSSPSPAWPPGRRGLSLGRGARPSFARPAVGPRGGLAEPKHTPCWLPPPAAGGVLNRAILGAGEEIPMSQIAPAVGTAPARRLKRPAAGGCGSIRFTPSTLRAAWDGTLDHAPHRGRGARPSRGGHHAHHPATAATARSRSALATSNHSDMAAQ